MTATHAVRFAGLLCSIIVCDVTFPAPNVPPKYLINYDYKPLFKTVYGDVRGYYMTSVKGRNIAAFEGIPYAEPPVGPLRFSNPERKKPWSDVLNGTSKGPVCMQMDPLRYYNVIGEENCLYLNIYIPQLDKDGKVPVIIFLHGGFFQYGSGNYYGPSYLLDEDVILVTLNYRLGPLGFFSSGDDDGAGNFGLKDQSLALGWVVENIERMGGDRDRIVLAGQDAGGVAAHLHMMSPLTKGLFAAAISQSGNAFSHWAFPKTRTVSEKFAEDFWCPTDKAEEMMTCMRTIKAKNLVSHQYKLYQWMEFPSVLFGPIVEHSHEDAFVLDTPENLYKKKEVAEKPWIVGITKDEGEIFPLVNHLGLLGTKRFLKELDKAIPAALQTSPDVTDEIRNFYLGHFKQRFSLDGSETVKDIGQMFGDRFFNVPFKKALETHTRYINSPVYGYFFSYKGQHGLPEKLRFQPHDWGVMHNDELQYLFNSTEYYPALYTTNKDYVIAENMVNLWSNFATTGEPTMNVPENKEMHHRFWEPYSAGNPKVLDINLEFGLIQIPYMKRLSFWKYINHY